MTDKEVMQTALDALNRAKRDHYYCEDRFYSCPKHEEGCANDLDGDECTCGADSVNETIDTATKALCAELAQTNPEPVAWYVYIPSEQCGEFFDFADDDGMIDWLTNYEDAELTELYTAPPQRKEWVGLTDKDVKKIFFEQDWCDDFIAFEPIVFVIEAKLRERNT